MPVNSNSVKFRMLPSVVKRGDCVTTLPGDKRIIVTTTARTRSLLGPLNPFLWLAAVDGAAETERRVCPAQAALWVSCEIPLQSVKVRNLGNGDFR
jgi:hypothetical protein